MSFPFIATIAFTAGLLIVIIGLALSLWRYRKPQELASDIDIPEDFGPRLTSGRLRYVRWLFALLVLAALGFHTYWSLFATGPFGENSVFEHLKNTRDQRHRREAESELRGWIFDRHHDIHRALAKYRYLNGQVIRDYPLGSGAAHVLGYTGLARGDAMLEKALPAIPPEKTDKSWWERVSTLGNQSQKVIGPDMTLTIDFDLQKEAAAQLAGRRGAVVVINPQTGELLALASSPSFDPDDINNDVRWGEITRDVKNRPLLNRALDEYYLPGSTFKTVTGSAAIDAHQDNLFFTCQSAGWTPPGSNRAIRDDEGEAHGRMALDDAYTFSCNQYFAQLGVAVERQRMAEAAHRFGMKIFETGPSSINAGPFRGLWNTDNKVLNDVFAPLYSTFVSSSKITKYDLALESIGQGFVQLTPFQMALIAGAVANQQGMVMRPKLELGRQPASLSQAMSPQTAARMRSMMASVVARGTAHGAFASLIAGKITAGGKTGTAQREVPVIDAKTEKPVTYRDSRGHEHVKREHRIDSWFIGFAPIENPQVAFAVVVEGGGYGARTSAPIAGNLLVKAITTGLLPTGDKAGEAAARVQPPHK